MREITGTFDIRFVEQVKQDVLNHRGDPEYKVLYLAPVPGCHHNYYVEIENFLEFDFDGFQQSPQNLLSAYAHFNKRTYFGLPFLVARVCKSECKRPDHPDDPFGFVHALRIASREGQLVDPSHRVNGS